MAWKFEPREGIILVEGIVVNVGRTGTLEALGPHATSSASRETDYVVVGKIPAANQMRHSPGHQAPG
jgi:NAD-dependent DNA ligase